MEQEETRLNSAHSHTLECMVIVATTGSKKVQGQGSIMSRLYGLVYLEAKTYKERVQQQA